MEGKTFYQLPGPMELGPSSVLKQNTPRDIVEANQRARLISNHPERVSAKNNSTSALSSFDSKYSDSSLGENTGASSGLDWADAIANSLNGFAQLLGTSATESNRFSQMSADKAMQFNAAEAAANRRFQSDIYRQTSAYNAAEAQKNRDWQEYMSNTSYQRAVEDLRKAGLNPILAYTQGGAKVSSGATASVGTLSGSSASGYAAHGNQDSSAAELFTAILSAAVNGVTKLFGSALSAFSILGGK